MTASPPAILPCPFLPTPRRAYTAADIQALGRDRGPRFYETALRYAQTLWLDGFPAKALLLVNRALSCCLPGVSLLGASKPYHAVAWMLQNRPEGLFIGNPRRHYQHLATRMVPPHKPLRTWRAWACWYLAKGILSETEHPSDEKQIREEGVVEPPRADIAAHLARLTPRNDLRAWEDALRWASLRPSAPAATSITFQAVTPDTVPLVQALAREIWHQVYPPIISIAQIEHMLGVMYDGTRLREALESPTMHSELILAGGTPAGYVTWEHLPAEGTAFLHRLYIKPACHGQGVGARALQRVLSAATHAGATHIRLRVNRKNTAPIRAYLRQGFTFECDICTDCGGGYVMDDHVMVRRLMK